ncbi:protein CsbA [Salinicoccus halodurans]|uniref:Protein CsbA n=1 Tax=Salinicoccus halodurans TaxID=407035 RepID=A0ABM5TC06_9STAP|nr:protein CsbA [Salinicoccus halodurans]
MYWYMMAMAVPAVTVVFFTRMTRNKYVAVILTFIIFGVSIYRGFYHSEWVIFIDAMSIVIGYMLVELYNLDKVEDE